MLKAPTIIGFLITAVIIGVGLSQIDLAQTIAAFSGVRLDAVAGGLVLMVAAIGVSSIRWRILLRDGHRVPFRLTFSYIAIGLMANAILPLRPGDLLRAYLLGRRHQIAVFTVLSSVVVERTFDVAALVIIGLGVSGMLDLPPLVEVGLRNFAVFAIIGIAVLIVLSFWGRLSKRPRWLDQAVTNIPGFSPVLQRFEIFCDALTALHSWRRLVGAAFLSLLAWAILATALTLLISSMDVKVPPLAGALVMIATSLGAAIPSAPASLGVYHALVVLALSVWDVPVEQATAVGVLLHAAIFGFQILLGLTCVWLAGISLMSVLRPKTARLPEPPAEALTPVDMTVAQPQPR